ncbi:MAG: DNA recombination/repair protein RecA, partial [Clostridia bacterium]|nr:DNA recombination/repair protein RecA [Clostridia bacterium]
MAAKEKEKKLNQDADADLAEGRKKAISAAMSQIEKKYGKGSIMKLGENRKMSVSAVSTGSLSLDLALGIGGLPRGRIVEIFGPE